MRDVLEKLKFAVFEFRLAPGRTVEFPGFKGNVFRGALGKTLRNLTCVFRGADTVCKSCFVRDKCIYSIFRKKVRIWIKESGYAY
jgi:hypothetical protein